MQRANTSGPSNVGAAGGVDRRRFVKGIGAGVAAGGLAWTAPQVLTARAAFAAGSDPSGADWTLRSPAGTLPPARHSHVMANDGDGNVLLFGGWDTFYMGDTWIWNGTAWVEQHPETVAAPIEDAAMATDPTGGAVRFGGGNSFYQSSETWVWA